MLKLAKLNSEGSSGSPHDSSTCSLDFASSSSLAFSPTTFSFNETNHSGVGIKIVIAKRFGDQYQIKKITSSPILPDTAESLFTSSTRSAEANIRPKRNITRKRYTNEVFVTTSEDSNDLDFALPCPKRRRTSQPVRATNKSAPKSKTVTPKPITPVQKKRYSLYFHSFRVRVDPHLAKPVKFFVKIL